MKESHRLVRLRGCHPELVVRVIDLVARLEEAGHDIIITDGVRTAAQQAALYAQGRTSPGKIVTNCDGVHKLSNHQAKGDGLGYAVDVAWRVEGRITWEGPWDYLGQVAEECGLSWGGRWSTFPDRPHLEWHPTVPIVTNG